MTVTRSEPPTPPRRFASLDIVRGVAVLGILLLNIVGFAMPEAAYENPRAYGGWHGPDLFVWAVNFILFDGKMRGLFSFLFGASMLLIADRAEAGGRDPARVHYTRMAWLLVFGLAHLWLVWDGDILAHYALVGMLAFPLRQLSTERMLGLGLLLVLVTTAMFALLPLQVWTLQHGAAAAAQAHAGQLRGLTETFGVPSPQTLARELATYRGGYGEILHARFAENRTVPLAMLTFYGPETLAYMLFGMAGLRSGLLTGAWTRAQYRNWLKRCWGIALPGYALLATYLIATRFALLSVTLAGLTLTALLRPLMIVGWACLILSTLLSGGALAERLAAAGRMAFTNYLATSLICTTLFYGYGLSWFGHLSRWQLYPLVALVWTLILLWSRPWLAAFRFGPFEWLWRSLARGAVQPIRSLVAG